MPVSSIRITYFQADKIAYPGVKHSSSPYRVTTYKGPEVSLLGALPAVLYKLHELNTAEAANADQYAISAPGFFERITGLRRQG